MRPRRPVPRPRLHGGGSGDSASIAALVTAFLVPFAAILVVRALLPASAMRGSGDGDAVASADAALRILD